MNPEMNHLQFLSLAPDRNGETGAECEIILPDYCPNILRILQTTAHPTLNSAVQTGDRLTVEGSVEYKILYLPEDGCGIKSVSQQAHFTCTIDLNCDADADYSVFLIPKNCVARALNPQKIYARCTVLIQVKINQTKAIPMPVLPGGCEMKSCKKKAAKHLCSAQKPLRISDEFEMDPGKIATEILQTKVTFKETEQKPLTDKLIVKADMILDLLCITDDHATFSLRKVFPISQILDLPGIHPDAVCKTGFELIASNFLAKDETTDGSQAIAYDVEIQVSGKVYEEMDAIWTEDVYSVKKSVECNRETVSTERFWRIEESGTIRETAEIGTCTGILWVEVKPELRGMYYRQEEDKLLCEGVWDCRILMTDADGTPCSSIREIPFTLELPAKGCKNPIRNDTTLILTDLSWSLADASHLEIKGTYRWNGLIFGRESAEAVTCITEKSDRPRSPDTVILYYASKGESAWKIAKEHACPYEELLCSNKLEQDEIDQDQMLIILSC